jgi:hypothetical protein
MDEIVKRDQAPAGWEEALAISEAQADAGDTVPASVVHKLIRDTIARLASRRDRKRDDGAERNR